ncbi:MAG: N-6 DNA methylase [Prevotellaceae bacterium]|jgi:tRNA1(Val) A37 N6-methylase TrmN6|nr:N-6 DNA methylase [Prevotellaceae bacterium]
MINKRKIAELLSCFSIEDVEREIVVYFLNEFHLDYFSSRILTDYLHNYNYNRDLSSQVKALEIDSIKTLENCLEMLIPDNDRKLNGAFFTPTYIVDYIIEEIKPKENDRNIDPSSGCGAFLIGLTAYYHKQYAKSIRKTVKENIFGADILPYNIERAKRLLSIYALQYGEILENEDFNLYQRDSLRYQWTEKYDNVVGNPPYVKFQDLSDENRDYLIKHWQTIENGTFNLYFAFFELGYNLLKEGGQLGYITPNNYFTSLAGESLRNFLINKKCLHKIIDFNSKKVFDVQTYTAISFLKKSNNDFVLYDRIPDTHSPEVFLSNVRYSENAISELNIKKWRLLRSDEKKNIKAIETVGTPIKQMFDICVGIATLKDDVFFVDSSKFDGDFIIKAGQNGKRYKIEKEVTRSVYKISDFKSQNDILQNARRIIFPYKVNGSATIIDEDNFKTKYPYCYEYLLSVKEELLSRDKGKIKYNPFYAWGRTQGLTRFGKKILNPTFSQYPRFLVVEDEEALFTNGYGIFFKEPSKECSLFGDTEHTLSKIENIDIVQKVLNSEIMHYYISKTSVSIEGGYPCYQKNFIEKFTIPEFSGNEVSELRSLSNQKDINLFLSDKYQVNFPVPNLSV